MKCDGFEMFHGTVKVVPLNDAAPFDVTGVWLFRPAWSMGTEEGCWYCKRDEGGPGFAESFPPDCLCDFRKDKE